MSEQAITEEKKPRSVKVENKSNYISRFERWQISRELQKHHMIFKRMWQMSNIRFSKRITTAAVMFDHKGKCIDFIVNREFWEGLTFIQKCFVISHECLHIALDHGSRSIEFSRNKLKWKISGIAQDLVINHAIVNKYGFLRHEIDPPIKLEEVLPIYEAAGIKELPSQEDLDKGRYCWIDKFFEPGQVTESENYEVYYNLLIEMAEKQLEEFAEKMKKSQTVDDHNANQGMPMPVDEGDEGDEGDETKEKGSGEGDNDDYESDGKPEHQAEGDLTDVDPEDYNYWDSEDHSTDFSEIIEKLDEEMRYEEKQGIENLIKENENMGEDTKPDSFPEENPDFGPTGESGGFSNSDDSDNSGMMAAGTTAGRGFTFVKKIKEPRKHKFEHIITSWARKHMLDEYTEADQWVHHGRRFMLMQNNEDEGGLMLPSEHETMDKAVKHDKIEVWFYQDTSGSCAGYKDRFFHIAEGMPLERFDMRMFCFDTLVYETTLESRKLYGGGGTYFHILEEHIQEEMRNNPKQRYPDAIFVVTDGIGTQIVPEKPKNWHWMLTPRHSKNCIPKECNFYDLADYQ